MNYVYVIENHLYVLVISMQLFPFDSPISLKAIDMFTRSWFNVGPASQSGNQH